MSEPTQPTTQLTNRLQKLERKISTRVEDAVRGLHEQLGERVRQASDDVLRWIDEHALELPSSYLEEVDLADVASEITAEHRAIDQALDAMRRIDGESTQVAILTALVEEARRFAGRTAFFLMREGRARAWASRGFGERDGLVGAELPAGGPWSSLAHGVVVLGEAARQEIARRLDTDVAAAAVLVPFVVRGSIAGALYAEQTQGEEPTLGVKGLQLVTYAATQALETSTVSPGTSPALLMAGATAPVETPEEPSEVEEAPAEDVTAAEAPEADASEVPAPDTSAPEAPEAPEAGDADEGLDAGVAAPLDEAPSFELDEAPTFEEASVDDGATDFPLDEPALDEPALDEVGVAAEPALDEPSFDETAPEAAAPEPLEPSFDDEMTFEEEPVDAAPALDPVAEAALEPEFETVDEQPAAAEGGDVDDDDEFFDGDETSPALSLEEPTVEVPGEPAEDPVVEPPTPDALETPEDLAAAAPPDVPDVEIDSTDGEPAGDFAYDSDAEPPSFDEIAEEQVPEPELEDTNIWELEDEEPDAARAAAAIEKPAEPPAFDPQVGQRTVRLDVAQIQEQARQGAAAAPDVDGAAADLPAAAPGSPDSLDSEEPTLISTPTAEPPIAEPPTAEPPVDEPQAAPSAPEPPAPAASHPSSFAEPSEPVAPTPPPAAPAPPPPQPDETSGSTEVRPPDDLQGPGLAFAAPQPSPVARDEGEEALHDEARRLARLLVSEIKLYNEEVIEEGRRTGNIYNRLKDDIDRSRQMYEERIDPRLADQEDYFYQELVQRLAGGDEKLLGM